MPSKLSTTASALALVASQALAATIDVKTDGIAFSPNSVSNVASGDQIRVQFSTVIPHNIISSTYQSPCTYNEAGGIASLTYDQGEVFVFTVNSTDPQWFYCDVGDHCNDGMIFAINPSSDESVSDAQSRAASADISKPGNTVAIGGAVAGTGDSAAEGSSSMASSMASSSMSMSGTMSMSTASMTTSGASMSTGAVGGSSGSMTSTGSAAAASTSSAAAPSGAPLAMAGALLAGAAAFVL